MTNTAIIRDAVASSFSPEQLYTLAAAHTSPEHLAKLAASVTVTDKKTGEQLDPMPEICADIVGGLFHTYNEWKQQGLQVKRGQKASLSCYLWRWTDKPSKAQREASKNDNDADRPDPHYYKTLSHLFFIDQVEKPAPVKVKTADEIKAYNAMLAEQRRARRAAEQAAKAAQQPATQQAPAAPTVPTKAPATTPAAPVVVAQTAHKDLHDNTAATATILAVPEQLDFAAIAAGVLA